MFELSTSSIIDKTIVKPCPPEVVHINLIQTKTKLAALLRIYSLFIELCSAICFVSVLLTRAEILYIYWRSFVVNTIKHGLYGAMSNETVLSNFKNAIVQRKYNLSNMHVAQPMPVASPYLFSELPKHTVPLTSQYYSRNASFLHSRQIPSIFVKVFFTITLSWSLRMMPITIYYIIRHATNTATPPDTS